MKTLTLARFIFSGTASLCALAAQPTKESSLELIGSLPAKPDVVLEWNAAISDHFEESSRESTPHIQARVYAMVHLAMRDAIAAATRAAHQNAAGAIEQSAATTAAHEILVALRRAGANRFASLHARQAAANADNGAAARGRQIGRRIAASVLSRRADDGWPVSLSPRNSGKVAIDTLRENTREPTPFLLKRVQQFEPEPPYFVYTDGVLLPNDRLQKKKLIGTPAEIADERTAGLWGTEPVVRWNRAAHSLAIQLPQDLHVRARMFAALNTALADALLSATYWNKTYSNGRTESLIEVPGAHDVLYLAAEAGRAPSHPRGPSWVNTRWSGFPAIPAALAGAAEAILRGSFSGESVFALPAKASDGGARTDFTNLRSAARQCAWAEFVAGASTPEGCVAGYDLGSRIAGHLLKQDRR